jgi:hypothetical protein
MAIGGKLQNELDKLYNDIYMQLEKYDQFKNELKQTAGNIKVYTGPKKGMFIINKHGKKVYIDRKTLKNNVPYIKKDKK